MQYGYVKPSTAKRRMLSQMREETAGPARRITGRIVLRETDKALLIGVEGEAAGQQVWVPKSQLADIERDGDRLAFTCPAWLAADKML